MDEGSPAYTGGRRIENLKPLETWWKVSSIILWVFLLVGALMLNATLLIAFFKRPGLRTISNRFVMNLTASNVLTCCVLNPLLILDSSEAKSDVKICAVAEGVTALVTACSIFSVFLIAIDQYLAVIDPLRYRTRVDTFKCSLLILSIWIISIIFSLVAALNPDPKSLWLICKPDTNYELRWMKHLNASSLIDHADGEIGEFITSFDNEGNQNSSGKEKCSVGGCFDEEVVREERALGLKGEKEDKKPSAVEKENRVKLMTNRKEDDEEHENMTRNMYGFIYMSTYSVFVYLLPFLGVCWIYISISSAAHKNSERTRKTGSRPILSSASFNVDHYYYHPVHQEISSEDFQKITKIPSLSSIDEMAVETSSSYHQSAMAFPNQNQTDISATISPVLFTVGCHVHDEESARNNTKDNMTKPVLKTQLFRVLQSDNIDSDEMTKCIMTNCDIVDNSLQPQNAQSSHQSACVASQSVDDNAQGGHNEDRVSFDLAIDIPHIDTTSKSDVIQIKKFDDELANSNTTNPIVTITPPCCTLSLQRIPSIHKNTTGGYINSLRCKISNGSLFKYREETRATRVSVFVIIMGLICWTPYVTVSLLRNSMANLNETFSHQTDVVALIFFILTTYVSPLLFGYRSKHVKRELMKFFCFKREFSYKHNRSLMAKKVLKRKRVSEMPMSVKHKTRCGLFQCFNNKLTLSGDKLEFSQIPESALAVDTCRSSFSSGASTQISTTSTEEYC